MSAPRYGRSEGSYCRYEGEHSQRHLEEFRSRKESSRLNMACRMGQAKRWGLGKQERGVKRKGQERAEGYIGMRSWGRGTL